LGKLRWIQPTRSGGDEKSAKKCLSNQQENNATIMEMEESNTEDGFDANITPTTSSKLIFYN
jgi:hypothetical protein